MKENDDERLLIKVVLESYVIRDKDGFEEFRALIRESAEYELSSLREYYERYSLPFNSMITRERAIVECEIVRKRYPNGYPDPDNAGKTFYRLFHDDDFFTELDHEPNPLEVINAIAYDVDWKPIQ